MHLQNTTTTAAAGEAALGTIGSLTVLELQAVEGQTAADEARWLAELGVLDLDLVYSTARRVVAKGTATRMSHDSSWIIAHAFLSAAPPRARKVRYVVTMHACVPRIGC